MGYTEKHACTGFRGFIIIMSRQHVDTISTWIKDYADSANMKTLVVGISGGIDSSVVSTLCAITGLKTIVVTMPIHQNPDQNDLSMRHAQWLTKQFDNVEHRVINLDSVFETFKSLFDEQNNLALANSRSRLRMVTLYQLAQTHSGLVVGTGNRVEDFGVGFYTKYGDGGVDISPIADCMKTQVWDMGRTLGVIDDIINAAPTDGLWDDGRNDEDQLGMSYAELERAMLNEIEMRDVYADVQLSDTERDQLETYKKIRSANLHKMEPIPVCPISE